MQIWLTYDYAIPFLLRANGFQCERQDYATSHYGNNWYVTNCPIPMDGDYTLPDGVIIEGLGGLELKIKNKEEIVLPGD